MSLLVVGTVALDTIETPFGKVERVVGGSATYFAAAAAYDMPPSVVAVVGDDLPMEQLDFLKRRGVDLSGIEIKKGERSFFWHGKYHHDLNTRDTLATELNVFGSFEPVVPPAAAASKYVFLANMDPTIQAKVLNQTRNAEFVAMDTMNYWIEGARDALDRVLQRVDCLILNDEEARQYAGEPSLVKCARVIQKAGPKTVIIKKGEHGAVMFNGERMFVAPAYPLEEVQDPTGAGDTFAGGVMGFIASEEKVDDPTLRRAVVKGSALASFCAEQFGVERLATLTHEDVVKRAKLLQSMVGFGAF